MDLWLSVVDSVVDNALACHLCDLGSNPGQGMWQGSGRPSRFCGFPPGSPVSSTTFDHITPTSAPLYSPVCVGPVRKPHCWFSHEMAHISCEITVNDCY